MSEYILSMPRYLTYKTSTEFCISIKNIGEYNKIIINFESLGFIEPFSIALISCELKRFIELRKNTEFSFINYEGKSYPAHMGFFKAIGVDYGNNPGQARGSHNYIPLTIFKVNELKKEARIYDHIGELIEEKANNMAKLLLREESGDLVDTLTFALREVMRNVVEHSSSEELEICAQYWPQKHEVEIVVLDKGIGIKKSLSNNPHLDLEDDRKAIHFALLPSISGKMYKGVRKRINDQWQNSGFGLYMIGRLARAGGNFFICSGKSGILLKGAKKTDLNTDFNGTILKVVINTDKVADLRIRLDKFREDGSKIAKQIENGHIINASTASVMLTRDFE